MKRESEKKEEDRKWTEMERERSEKRERKVRSMERKNEE
jgi:hypothetical protein